MAKNSRGRRGASRLKPASARRGYVLRLYITGQTSLSSASVRNLLRVCQDHLASQYEVQVIDICQQPELAREAQIIATPTLVKTSPAPMRKLVGNLSSQREVLKGLGIRDEKRPN
jgi:circadian clock protein KaiB